MPRSPQQLVLTTERQQRAQQLKQQGWTHNEIAQMLGVAPSTISRWLQASSRQITQTVSATYAKLTTQQLEQLLYWLLKGPSAHGLSGANWSHKTIRGLIQYKFAVNVAEDDIPVILQVIGWQLNTRVTRLRAWELKRQGKSPAETAHKLGVPVIMVEQWYAISELIAHTPVRQRQTTSVNSKLSTAQLREVSQLLLKPPPAYGISASVWTRQAICQLIHQTYGVSFSLNHIPYLLRRIKRLLYTQTPS